MKYTSVPVISMAQLDLRLNSPHIRFDKQIWQAVPHVLLTHEYLNLAVISKSHFCLSNGTLGCPEQEQWITSYFYMKLTMRLLITSLVCCLSSFVCQLMDGRTEYTWTTPCIGRCHWYNCFWSAFLRCVDGWMCRHVSFLSVGGLKIWQNCYLILPDDNSPWFRGREHWQLLSICNCLCLQLPLFLSVLPRIQCLAIASYCLS